MVMVLVGLMTSALAITELMASLLGLSLIALEELAPNLQHGLVMYKTQITLTLWLSARIKDAVTETPASVCAIPTTMELLASVPFALTDALMLVFVSLRSNLPLKLLASMTLLGMLRSK